MKNKILAILLIVIISMLLGSCAKGQIEERQYVFDKYEMIIDWYSLDTTRVIKAPAYRQFFDSIWKPETRMAFDTCSDKWYIDCNMLEVLQHLYYTKNGRKIQPSNWPKSK